MRTAKGSEQCIEDRSVIPDGMGSIPSLTSFKLAELKRQTRLPNRRQLGI